MVNLKIFDVTDWTTITIHILPNISKSKGNQVVEFGHLIFSFKNHTKNAVERLVPNLFLFFKKALYKVKQMFSTLVLIYFGRPQLFFLKKKKKMGFTPCKTKQPLRGMKLHEKKHKKDYRIQKVFRKNLQLKDDC